MQRGKTLIFYTFMNLGRRSTARAIPPCIDAPTGGESHVLAGSVFIRQGYRATSRVKAATTSAGLAWG